MISTKATVPTPMKTAVDGLLGFVVAAAVVVVSGGGPTTSACKTSGINTSTSASKRIVFMSMKSIRA